MVSLGSLNFISHEVDKYNEILRNRKETFQGLIHIFGNNKPNPPEKYGLKDLIIVKLMKMVKFGENI